jgi:glycosyltransferase involved in cell wall biosynthesis
VLYRLALRKNNLVVFQNHDELELFRAMKLIPKSVDATVVDGSGVDVDFFFPEESLCHSATFVMVARVLVDKGVREFVAAARMVREKLPEARFVLVGAEDENPGCVPKNEIEQWKRENVIEFVGEVDDVRPYLRSADVFVLPSYNEGLPRSSLEALAIGLPILTTDVPGCRETVTDGVNGLLVEVKNAKALADAMCRVVEDKELMTRMGYESRKLAEQRFDIRKINAAMVDALGL